ncbi:MAG TPA: hypothetical protein VMI54_19425 [Polyangiaceae bacterium]|nr:hypothetical protein [Polyangiaceae bacterium]
MWNGRRGALALIAVSAGVLVYVIGGSSDEDRILARLREIARAVETRPDETDVARAARIDGVFETALEPGVTFGAPELPAVSGVRPLAVFAAAAPASFGELTLSVGATDIHVEGAIAHAVSELTLTGSRGGELRREHRSVRCELRRSGAAWRVGAIEVEPEKEAQPEARP